MGHRRKQHRHRLLHDLRAGLSRRNHRAPTTPPNANACKLSSKLQHGSKFEASKWLQLGPRDQPCPPRGQEEVDVSYPCNSFYAPAINPPHSPQSIPPKGVVLKGIFPRGGEDAQVRLAAGSWDSGVSASSGDGGPAISAELAYPKGIAVGADDSFYVAEFQGGRVRRVSTSGVISTAVGTGSTVRWVASDNVGEHVYGTFVFLSRWISHPDSVKIFYTSGADGILSPCPSCPHFPEDVRTSNSRPALSSYRSLTAPRPRLLPLASTNVASLPGPGGKAYEGDGGPASEAGLDLPNAIAFSPGEAGSVMVIADFGHSAVRAVTLSRPCT